MSQYQKDMLEAANLCEANGGAWNAINPISDPDMFWCLTQAIP